MAKSQMHPGKVIRNYRKIKGLTIRIMGETVGVSLQQYQKYEAWKSLPPYDKLEIIIRTLEIPPAKLFDVGKISDSMEQFEKKLTKYGKIIRKLENDPNLMKMINAYGVKSK